MLIDTSAIIAIMADEPDAKSFVNALETATSHFVGAHVRLECTINIMRILGLSMTDAQTTYDGFLETVGAKILPITDDVSRIAADAYGRFGKGQGHPAQLNFADCLSYACAIAVAAPILFKGGDFSRTDLQTAL